LPDALTVLTVLEESFGGFACFVAGMMVGAFLVLWAVLEWGETVRELWWEKSGGLVTPRPGDVVARPTLEELQRLV
jgi:hypothetical protein